MLSLPKMFGGHKGQEKDAAEKPAQASSLQLLLRARQKAAAATIKPPKHQPPKATRQLSKSPKSHLTATVGAGWVCFASLQAPAHLLRKVLLSARRPGLLKRYPPSKRRRSAPPSLEACLRPRTRLLLPLTVWWLLPRAARTLLPRRAQLERLRNELKHAQENEASAKEMLAKSKEAAKEASHKVAAVEKTKLSELRADYEKKKSDRSKKLKEEAAAAKEKSKLPATPATEQPAEQPKVEGEGAKQEEQSTPAATESAAKPEQDKKEEPSAPAPAKAPKTEASS